MIKRVDSGGQVHLVTNIRKPRKWRRYEYLLSSGTLYIDTGINGYMNHRYELDYQLTGTGSYRMWGVFGLSSWLGYNMSITYASGRCVRWSSTSDGLTLVDNLDTITNTDRHTIIINNGEVYYDSVDKGKSSGHSNSCIVNYSIYLFTVNPANTTPTANAVARVYSYKDYDASGNLVRHMVPAQYNGQYGMWDLVEDKFYPNKGTGTFTVGPEIKNYDEIDEVRKTTSLLPSGVELYDYILSSGTLYIDSGVIANQDISTELKAQYTNVNYGSNLWPALIGAADNNTKRFCIRALDTKKILGVFGSTSYGTATVDTSIHTYKLSKTLFVIDSTSIGVTSSTFSSYSMYLFTENHLNNSGYEYRMASAKMYYCKIWNGSTLVRNFLPCTYLGEPGMWDTVENKFYRNQGTGQFTLGNKITLKEYEYLEANKAPYIDTQFIPKGNTSVEMQLMALSSTQNNGFFGAYGSGWADNSYGFYGWSGEKIWNNYKNDVAVGTYTSIFPINTIHKVFKDKNTLYIDNRLTRQDAYTNFTAPYTLLIFDINKSNSRCPAKMRLYYTKIWDNNTLVRDFIPISYNGTPGLWDKVEWKFYANAGSGSFTLGPEKKSGIYSVRRNITVDELFTFRQTANGEKLMKNTAKLNGIKGNSIAWNQLINNNSFPSSISTNGISGTSDTTKGSVKFTGTCSAYSVINIGNSNVPVILDHKYLFIGAPAGASNADPATGTYDYRINNNGQYLTVLNAGLIWTSNRNGTINCYIRFNKGAQNVNVTFYPRLFDLTLIYGSGNEPSSVNTFVLDCYKWFGKHPCSFLYDAGSIRAVKSTELKSVGFNQLNDSGDNSPQFIGNYYIDSNSAYNKGSNNNFRCYRIPVLQNTVYYLSSDSPVKNLSSVAIFRFVDANLNFISGAANGFSSVGASYTTPTGTKYIELSTNKAQIKRFVLNISDSSRNGTYYPYNRATLPLNITTLTGKLNGSGNSVIVFPDGMKKVGTVYDEIKVENGVTKAIKRILSKIFNGSETFTSFTGSNNYIKSDATNAFYSVQHVNATLLNNYLRFVKNSPIWNTIGYPDCITSNAGTQIHLNFSNSKLGITNPELETVNSAISKIKAYLASLYNSNKPLIVYYILPTPEEYILDNFNLPQSMQVERGGTEEVISSDITSVGPTLQLQYTV